MTGVKKADFTKLVALAEGLGRKHRVRVGIMGNKATSRTEAGETKGTKTPSELTNAEIGAIHEYGAPKAHIPPRSFLRIPIRDNGAKILAEAYKGFNDVFKAVFDLSLWKRLGIAAENQVQEAFQKGGPGWTPLKPATVRAKGSSAILIETAQLRRSIASVVVKA